MKTYIKPETNVTEIEISNLMSLSTGGNSGVLTPGGTGGASGGRAKKNYPGTLWEDSFEEMEEEEENE